MPCWAPKASTETEQAAAATPTNSVPIFSLGHLVMAAGHMRLSSKDRHGLSTVCGAWSADANTTQHNTTVSSQLSGGRLSALGEASDTLELWLSHQHRIRLLVALVQALAMAFLPGAKEANWVASAHHRSQEPRRAVGAVGLAILISGQALPPLQAAPPAVHAEGFGYRTMSRKHLTMTAADGLVSATRPQQRHESRSGFLPSCFCLNAFRTTRPPLVTIHAVDPPTPRLPFNFSNLQSAICGHSSAATQRRS
ncbi:hypothetical protein LZ30DRAFT_685869 [Colletotrichum cereale]|nr:hypothetical protein LZ30DRAFT_685869 [Colletotrichum cereale]